MRLLDIFTERDGEIVLLDNTYDPPRPYVALTFGWTWLDWSFGPSVYVDPVDTMQYTPTKVAATLDLGPLTVSVEASFWDADSFYASVAERMQRAQSWLFPATGV